MSLSIAIFCESYHPMRNGVVVSVDSFTRMLTAMGHQVTIFTAHHPDQQTEEEHVYRLPSIMFPTRARYPIAIPIATGEARRMLVEEQFDLIHSHSPMAVGHVAVSFHRRLGIPLVFTYHTLLEEYSHYIPLPERWVRRRAIAISRTYSNQANHIVTPTRHVADRLRRYGVTRPITIIPTGIDVDLIDAVPEADVRARYQIPAGVPLLAYAGRIAKEKNLPRVLGGFRELLRQEPDAHLLLLGGGAYEEEIRALIEEMGLAPRTRMTGLVPRDEVMQGLRAADLFVFASQTETQGLVIGEAMACHTPVVAVNADAPRELITHGYNGLLTPDADGPFAEAMRTLLRDPALRREMGRRARANAEEVSAERCTQRLLSIYHGVLGPRAEETVGSD